jgi:hypothetical protein
MRCTSVVTAFSLLLVASGSLAAVPSPATSVVPHLVGCPAGDLGFTVLVRDAASNPVTGSTVILSFASCPSFTHCSESFPGYVWNPAARTAAAVTDSAGQATFSIHQGGVCTSVSVSADGVPLGTRSFASTDQNSDLQVNPADVALVLEKLGTNDGTADFDGNGLVDTVDVSVVLAHAGHICGETPSTGANAGPDTTVACAGPAGTFVQLDGTASQGTSLTFYWSAPGITFDDPTSATPTGLFPTGTTAVLLQVQSDQGPSQDEVLVTVQDTQPPNLEVSLSPAFLWPPDRRLMPIHATVSANDSCQDDSVQVTLFSITVIEGDSTILAPGDDVQGAALGTADFDFALRAERTQGLTRTYVVCYQARDGSGNATEVCKNVVVGRGEDGAQARATPLELDAENSLAFGARVSPNPAGARATLVYSLPEQGHTRLRVFDLSGRAVATLVDGVVPAGRHTATFDQVRRAGASLYFYVLESNGRRASGKVVMAK